MKHWIVLLLLCIAQTTQPQHPRPRLASDGGSLPPVGPPILATQAAMPVFGPYLGQPPEMLPGKILTAEKSSGHFRALYKTPDVPAFFSNGMFGASIVRIELLNGRVCGLNLEYPLRRQPPPQIGRECTEYVSSHKAGYSRDADRYADGGLFFIWTHTIGSPAGLVISLSPASHFLVAHPVDPKVAVAIGQETLVIGMTEEEAQAAMLDADAKARSSGQDSFGNDFIEYREWTNSSGVITAASATFRNGKLIDWHKF